MSDKIPLALEENRHINPLNAELNPICCLLALLGAHHFFHVSRIRVNLRLVGPGGRAVKATATLEPEPTQHNSLDRLQIRKYKVVCLLLGDSPASDL
jgi:hypothetical protein